MPRLSSRTNEPLPRDRGGNRHPGAHGAQPARRGRWPRPRARRSSACVPPRARTRGRARRGGGRDVCSDRRAGLALLPGGSSGAVCQGAGALGPGAAGSRGCGRTLGQSRGPRLRAPLGPRLVTNDRADQRRPTPMSTPRTWTSWRRSGVQESCSPRPRPPSRCVVCRSRWSSWSSRHSAWVRARELVAEANVIGAMWGGGGFHRRHGWHVQPLRRRHLSGCRAARPLRGC
jgi:hypothetical protein